MPLAITAKLVGYATPAVRDYKSESATDEFNARRDAHPRGKPLSYQAVQASGQNSKSSPSETGSTGVLNPELSRWLMGFPVGWDCLKATETPLFPN
jgi:hypothetical protein